MNIIEQKFYDSKAFFSIHNKLKILVLERAIKEVKQSY